MASLRKALPPVNSLVVFESAARHLNFTHAAEELGVTQAAVSRQIHLLEEHLGAPLFERLPRRLKLTKDGERFWRAVSSGLDHIAGAATDIRRAHAASEVTIATSVTFASYWLMARLMEFRSRHPAVEIRLVAASPVRRSPVLGRSSHEPLHSPRADRGRPRDRALRGVGAVERHGAGRRGRRLR